MGISIWLSFRIEFWNDYVSYIQNKDLFEELKLNLKIFIASETSLLGSVLNELDFLYEIISVKKNQIGLIYYFPINKLDGMKS